MQEGDKPKTNPDQRQVVNAPIRVAIIGAGNVGATYAYSLLFSGLAAEIVLVNRNPEKAEGEAMDLSHAVPFNQSTRIWAGEYADCAGATLTVITAGEADAPGGDRLALLDKNIEIFRSIVPEVARHNPAGIILVATNPVDVLTYATLKLSGLEPRQVIGSGTILDSSRLQSLLGQHFKVDPRDVQASIIGEHGASAVPVWSQASVAGIPLAAFGKVRAILHDQPTLDKLFEETREAANEITRRKGATFYGVATGLLRITEAILLDQRSVLTVSSLYSSEATGEAVEGSANQTTARNRSTGNVCLSLPTIVDRTGVAGTIQLAISHQEKVALEHSIGILREAVARLKLA